MGILRYSADWRVILFVGIYYVMAFYGYLNFHELSWGVMIPLLIATSIFSFITATITHNIVHAPVFKSRFLNKIWQIIMTNAYGHPVSAFVPGHNLSHHLHTQTRRDVMRTQKARFKWNLLNQVFFAAIVAGDISKADMAYTKSMYKEKPAWFRQWVAEWASFLLLNGVLLYLDWRAWLVFIQIPHWFAAWGIVGINFVQHDGADQDHPYNHSRNLVGPVINWFVFNNGFHAIHHEQPGLHWSLLPAAHNERIKPHVHPNLDVPNFATYCFKAYIYPGKRVDYLGNPYSPEPAGEDEAWIPKPSEIPDGVSLGAES